MHLFIEGLQWIYCCGFLLINEYFDAYLTRLFTIMNSSLKYYNKFILKHALSRVRFKWNKTQNFILLHYTCSTCLPLVTRIISRRQPSLCQTRLRLSGFIKFSGITQVCSYVVQVMWQGYHIHDVYHKAPQEKVAWVQRHKKKSNGSKTQ